VEKYQKREYFEYRACRSFNAIATKLQNRPKYIKIRHHNIYICQTKKKCK